MPLSLQAGTNVGIKYNMNEVESSTVAWFTKVRRVAGAHCCAQAPSERYVSLSSSYRSSLSNAPFDWRDAVSPRVHPGCAVAYGNWGEAGRGFLSYLYHLYFARSGGGCAIP